MDIFGFINVLILYDYLDSFVLASLLHLYLRILVKMMVIRMKVSFFPAPLAAFPFFFLLLSGTKMHVLVPYMAEVYLLITKRMKGLW